MSTQERRKYPRTEMDLPLELTLDNATLTSRIFDMSTSGIRFWTPQALPLMSRVQLAIQLGERTTAPLALSGVVVRSGSPASESGDDETSTDDGGAFETAIFFDDLSETTHRQLSQFLAGRQI